MKKIGFIIVLFMCSLLVLSACEPPRDYETEIQTAIDNRDAESLASIILDYTEAGLGEKLAPIVEQYFFDLAAEQDYSNFSFMRTTIEDLGETDESQTLSAICDEQYPNEVKGFLAGNWVRKDATDLDGAIITVSFSDDASIAILTNTDNILVDFTYFAVGDVKWDDIKIIDRNTFKYSDLSKGEESAHYVTALGTIDYENYSISTHASADDLISVSGTNQTWVREDYYNSFGVEHTLSEEDFLVTINGDTVSLFDPGNSFSFYYSYDSSLLTDASNVSEEDIVESFVTNRGIDLDNTLDDVLAAYGLGSKSLINTSTDSMCIFIDTTLKQYGYDQNLVNIRELMNNKLKYYMQYNDAAGEKRLRFYFDDKDTVKTIILLRKEPADVLYYMTDGTTYWWEIDFGD